MIHKWSIIIFKSFLAFKMANVFILWWNIFPVVTWCRYLSRREPFRKLRVAWLANLGNSSVLLKMLERKNISGKIWLDSTLQNWFMPYPPSTKWVSSIVISNQIMSWFAVTDISNWLILDFVLDSDGLTIQIFIKNLINRIPKHQSAQVRKN